MANEIEHKPFKFRSLFLLSVVTTAEGAEISLFLFKTRSEGSSNHYSLRNVGALSPLFSRKNKTLSLRIGRSERVGFLRHFINMLGYLASELDEGDNAGEMSPRSSTECYPAFAHIGLRENPGKNLNQVVWVALVNPMLTEYADIVYVFGLCDGSSLSAAAEYERRFPNRRVGLTYRTVFTVYGVG
ncbi:hypothetical protein ANN_23016 [Periplaneta americana]|uniref:DUF4817 domain-containing protein n=1 Tax=Periplaneta americana TaxID=6978 RepID=A0ABQ8SJX1_PERAM|nr:hypothetical protein ANN_23016 [Periplaneta americana]